MAPPVLYIVSGDVTPEELKAEIDRNTAFTGNIAIASTTRPRPEKVPGQKK